MQFHSATFICRHLLTCYQFWRKGRRHFVRLHIVFCFDGDVHWMAITLDGNQINLWICWSKTTIITITAIHSKNIMIDVIYVWIYNITKIKHISNYNVEITGLMHKEIYCIILSLWVIDYVILFFVKFILLVM